MTGLARKIVEAYSGGGPAGLAAAILRALHARTLGRLDLLLFSRLKWKTLRRWTLRPFFYRAAKLLRITEAEHQIGRLMNMRAALEEIKRSGLQGDIVEFGSYQGFSLYWLSRFRDELGLSMKVIGVDSFEGLPETSTVWKKGLFGDTSREACERAILEASGAGSLASLGIHIIQGLFNDPRVAGELRGLTSRVVLAHIDCDLGSSCAMALPLIPHVGGTLYLLFDDWGCHPDEIPPSFRAFIKKSWHGRVEKISATRYTRYFRLTGGVPSQ